MLTFNGTEEKAIEKAIAGLAHIIPLEAMPPPHFPTLIFPGLEIRLHQRRVLKGGADINLTRLEYRGLSGSTIKHGGGRCLLGRWNPPPCVYELQRRRRGRGQSRVVPPLLPRLTERRSLPFSIWRRFDLSFLQWPRPQREIPLGSWPSFCITALQKTARTTPGSSTP